MHFAIIDDHPFVLDALSVIISSMERRPSVSGFESLQKFEAAAGSGESFDLVLLDLGIPGYGHLESLHRFRSLAPVTPVVVISASDDRETVLEALDLGAMGFIPKTSHREVLTRALELVLAGGIYIPPQALEKHAVHPAKQLRREGTVLREPELDARYGPSPGVSSLSKRQRDVLNLLVKGMPNKLICRELGLSANTVKSHVGAIFRALNASNRTQAVIAAQRSGFRVDYQRSSSSDSP
ncbi:MAG TPA: response regulator transcription factor [Casimicrobiaceae bacterium]|nr:response regulator transcription factor [Casimicrobiaceae bacterium]